jgi:hypothetical protein
MPAVGRRGRDSPERPPRTPRQECEWRRLESHQHLRSLRTDALLELRPRVRPYNSSACSCTHLNDFRAAGVSRIRVRHPAVGGHKPGRIPGRCPRRSRLDAVLCSYRLSSPKAHVVCRQIAVAEGTLLSDAPGRRVRNANGDGWSRTNIFDPCEPTLSLSYVPASNRTVHRSAHAHT